MRNTRSDSLVSRSDWAFVAAMAAVAVVAAALLWSAGAGTRVVFRLHGRIVEERSLLDDGDVVISGEYSNVFRIEDGTVRVVETDCPNHQCERTGRISRAGQSIACVPNEATATIEGGEEQVDALVG